MSENETPATIAFDDFMKVDIRVGEITKSERVPKSDKLLKLEVYLGELGTRTIVAGIAKSYDADAIVGQRCLVVVNLAPRKMMGVESHGMLLAGVNLMDVVTLATCDGVPWGTRIG
jgi:methionyl-tRNA synthetase